jgi:rare lipoprotein A
LTLNPEAKQDEKEVGPPMGLSKNGFMYNEQAMWVHTAARVDSKLSGLRVILLGCSLMLATGCRHRNQAIAVPPPPPPPPSSTEPASPPSPAPGVQNAPLENAAIADSPADADFVRSHRAISTQEGLASWYGPPYDKHPGANGKIYDENALTAAHRTLPLNSLIQVTNLSTGQSVIVRVTDRGPFVSGRILDLSLASAKAIGVWRPGVARVRVDVFAAPSPLDQGGRWCVQVGVFKDNRRAIELRDQLTRKYQTATVIEFAGPTGFWVRIRPLHDDKNRAFEIARDLKSSEGEAYLVRLD